MILEMTRPVQGGLRQERKLENTSNHLANADTTGFKKDVISFDAVFKARLDTDYSQGSIKVTGNELDVALQEDGLFKISTSQGMRYTRSGNFTLDANGVLVDQNGNSVQGRNGTITIDGDTIQINRAGEISVDGAVIDSFDIVTFDNKSSLEKQGNNYFLYNGGPGDEKLPEIVSMQQGALEGSNVKAVNEMVHMIDHHRMYETFQKMMQTFDEVDSKAINDVGKLQ